MKVIGINGSPRKNANTMTLVKTVLNGAAERGAETRLVNLGELQMKGCLACDGCKKRKGKCVQKDDLSPLLEELKSYDVIVLGSPVYFYQVSSQLKAFIDRNYCHFTWIEDLETGEFEEISYFPSNKKIVILTSRGDEEDPEMFSELYEYLEDWLKAMAGIFKPSAVEIIHHFDGWNDRNAAKNNSKLMGRVKLIGASMV